MISLSRAIPSECLWTAWRFRPQAASNRPSVPRPTRPQGDRAKGRGAGRDCAVLRGQGNDHRKGRAERSRRLQLLQFAGHKIRLRHEDLQRQDRGLRRGHIRTEADHCNPHRRGLRPQLVMEHLHRRDLHRGQVRVHQLQEKQDLHGRGRRWRPHPDLQRGCRKFDRGDRHRSGRTEQRE